MLADIAFLVLGLVILVGAGDALVRGAVALSLRIGMPAVIVSATVVAFGTSAPELIISVEAVLEGASELALGNVVGSNIANVLLVLGLPAMLAPIAAGGTGIDRNLWIMVGVTAVFSALVLLGDLEWWGGLILLVLIVAMLVDSVRSGMVTGAALAGAGAAPAAGGAGETSGIRSDAEAEALAELGDIDPNMSPLSIGLLLVAGLVGLPIGAQFLVDASQSIARDLGVSEAVIGVTIVALGTSLPELATTVMAALRNQAEVAIGNVVGSNIFNITAIIGIAALFGTIDVPASLLAFDLWVMIGATLFLVPFVVRHWTMGRVVGACMCAAYVAFVAASYAA